MWHWVARGNIQQINYIPQTEQHLPFRLMLLRLGNVTIICIHVCMYICMYVCMFLYMYVYMYVCMYIVCSFFKLVWLVLLSSGHNEGQVDEHWVRGG